MKANPKVQWIIVLTWRNLSHERWKTLIPSKDGDDVWYGSLLFNTRKEAEVGAEAYRSRYGYYHTRVQKYAKRQINGVLVHS